MEVCGCLSVHIHIFYRVGPKKTRTTCFTSPWAIKSLLDQFLVAWGRVGLGFLTSHTETVDEVLQCLKKIDATCARTNCHSNIGRKIQKPKTYNAGLAIISKRGNATGWRFCPIFNVSKIAFFRQMSDPFTVYQYVTEIKCSVDKKLGGCGAGRNVTRKEVDVP